MGDFGQLVQITVIIIIIITVTMIMQEGHLSLNLTLINQSASLSFIRLLIRKLR